jgi:phosphoglycerate dehydrogenase-like enzyme
MPSVLIGPYLLRKQPGRFREVFAEAGFEVIEPEGGYSLTAAELAPHLPGISAMLAGGEVMGPAQMDLAPGLRVIARVGVGYDLVDVDAATERKIAVTITPGTNQESVAEQTFGLLLGLTRRIAINDRVIHGGGWDRRLVAPIRGLTLGLVGLGRIGRAVAERAAAFRMNIVSYDTVQDAEFDAKHGIKRVGLEELLAVSDVVTLHLPLLPSTRGMVNREFLAKMKQGSYLINTARGALVVESDLRDAVGSGHLAGAGLDVLSQEPPLPDNPLLGVPNILLSPHIAGTDTQSIADMAEMAAKTIVRLSHNEWPGACVVNPQLQAVWAW